MATVGAKKPPVNAAKNFTIAADFGKNRNKCEPGEVQEDGGRKKRIMFVSFHRILRSVCPFGICGQQESTEQYLLGRSPSGGLGAEPLATILRRSRPGFGAEPQLIQSSQPVWSRREKPNLSESSLAGGL